MTTNLSGLALALSFGALVVAGYAILQERSAPTDLEARLSAIDDRVARIEEAVTTNERRTADGPALAMTTPRLGEPMSSTGAVAPKGGATPAEVALPRRTPGDSAPSDPEVAAAPTEEIQELINAAVEKKAAEIQRMRNKKPSIDEFAKTLELTDLQRRAVEEDVVQSQREIKAILEIPAEDGTNFMDELVEVMAHGIAQPGQNPGRGMKLFGRLMSEKIPGSDETYAVRVEGVKGTLRASFKRNWNEKQYAAFEAWRMDPTEVKDIEGSPWKDVEARVIERAKDLGAEIPDNGK